jgi:signal transduction histidine kinase
MPRLWSQIAGALGLLTLAVLVLNAGVFWIVIEQGAVKRHTDLAWSLGGAMEAQLGAAVRSGADEEVLIDAVNAVGRTNLGLETLALMSPQLRPLVIVKGDAPADMDVGLRAALLAKERHIEVDGNVFDRRRVVVTVPVVGTGKPVAVLRIALPLEGPQIPGGPIGFAVFYVIACGGLIALFGWSRLHRTMVVPIQRLQKGTETIASGDFGYRLAGEGTQELQALVGSLNDMSSALAAYREQTAEQVNSLETANASLRRAQDALIRSERLAGVGRMAAGLAHEVGNPLAAVIATVDVLHDGSVGDEAQGEMLRRARVELERIHIIIQSLLGYAHHGSGSASRVEVAQVLSAAVSTVEHQPIFQHKRVSIIDVEPKIHVWMEENKLHQVVVNLLHNAADAPQSTEIVLRLAVLGEDEIELRCEDNGQGFEPTALEQAFEPFFTTKDVGAGTGLGLSTCMAVIEQAGGTIEAFNRPESGACVRIRLPLSRS